MQLFVVQLSTKSWNKFELNSKKLNRENGAWDLKCPSLKICQSSHLSVGTQEVNVLVVIHYLQLMSLGGLGEKSPEEHEVLIS